MRNALVGGIAGLLAGLLIVLLGQFLGSGGVFAFPQGKLLVLATLGGLGLMSGAGGTAVMQHYTLRLLLTKAGATPTAYGRFLEAAVDGLLLRRVGGGHRFAHRLLQERFATYSPAAPVVSARELTGTASPQPLDRDEAIPHSSGSSQGSVR